ncbi:MAG: hypothetical protein K6G88_06685 [Lachnospiraceae bacterium]|jgi:hypothetical protein|nr:hypothetical protein [Lachnospiraceae bacterium]
MSKEKFARFTVLGIALVLIGVGVYTGEFVSVYRKASMICFECIGIG